MNGHQEAVAKVAKLLRLAKSTNPHEAALAASRAQEIMDRHKLTGSDLSQGEQVKSDEPVKHWSHDPLDTDGSARWKGQLGVTIAKLNQCKLYRRTNATYCLIGRASDVQTVRYLYGWLVREIERLASENCAGCGRTYWNNFRLGAVETVSARLQASAKVTVETVKNEAASSAAGGDNGRALAIVEKSLATIERQRREVDDYGKTVLRLRSRRASRSTFDPSAREAGRQAGKTIRMTQAAGSLGAGYAKLEGRAA